MDKGFCVQVEIGASNRGSWLDGTQGGRAKEKVRKPETSCLMIQGVRLRIDRNIFYFLFFIFGGGGDECHKYPFVKNSCSVDSY